MVCIFIYVFIFIFPWSRGAARRISFLFGNIYPSANQPVLNEPLCRKYLSSQQSNTVLEVQIVNCSCRQAAAPAALGGWSVAEMSWTPICAMFPNTRSLHTTLRGHRACSLADTAAAPRADWSARRGGARLGGDNGAMADCVSAPHNIVSGPSLQSRPGQHRGDSGQLLLATLRVLSYVQIFTLPASTFQTEISLLWLLPLLLLTECFTLFAEDPKRSLATH